jgi:hypothetical protein
MTWMLGLLQLLSLLLLELAPDHDVDEEAAEEEEARDPYARIKALESEKDRHAKNAIKARAERDEAVAELEAERAGSDDLRLARLETAFLREVMRRGQAIDVETAWDLAGVKGFLDLATVGHDGEVEGIVEATDRLLDRYPFLTDADLTPSDSGEGLPRSAPPPRKRKDSSALRPPRETLEQRFPHLRKHR